MKHINLFQGILACTLLANTGAVFAQHPGHAAASPAASPYAGQQVREIKALSPAQAADLLEGKGMEQAKAAELNGYPGPMHVLELAGPLALNVAQVRDSEALLVAHKAEARSLGARLVETERKLDAAFAGKQIDTAQLEQLARQIGLLQAELRASHLRTHLQQTRLLTAPQVALYAELRGYTGATGTAAPDLHSNPSH
jgi:Spy/CpxP family protein refolding chaperone